MAHTTSGVATLGAVACLLLLTSCGGAAAPNFEQTTNPQAAGSLSKATTFSGELEGAEDTPAVIRWVSLKAGDALRGYVVPSGPAQMVQFCRGSSSTDCVTKKISPTRTAVVTATVSASDATWSGWSSLSDSPSLSSWYSQQNSENDFFSDNTRPSNGAGVLMWNSGWDNGDPDVQQIGADGLFWVRGYPEFDGNASSSWFMFIAPADGTYGIVVGGYWNSQLPCPKGMANCSEIDPWNQGPTPLPFSISLQSHALTTGQLESVRTAGASDQLSDPADQPGSPFPYFASAWVALVNQQLPWLFSSGFFPPENTFLNKPGATSGHKGSYAPSSSIESNLSSQVQNDLSYLKTNG